MTRMLGFIVYCVFFSFTIVNIVEVDNPSHFPVSVLISLPYLTDIMPSFIFKSKCFNFVVIIRIFG